MPYLVQLARINCTALILGIIAFLPNVSSMAQEPVEDVICVLPLRKWMGSAVETAAIENKPVPDSFNELHTNEGNCGSGLNRPSLFDWHQRYGSETSSLAARHYFETTEPFIPKFSPSTLWRETDTKYWRQSLEKIMAKLEKAIKLDDERTVQRIVGDIYNNISDLTYLVGQINVSLNMAEIFSSETWLRYANDNIAALDKSLSLFDGLTHSFSEKQIGDSLLVRGNLKYTLARNQARAALMAAYLGDRDKLKDAEKFIKKAYDPAYDKFIDLIYDNQFKQCESFSEEDFEKQEFETFCTRTEENGGLKLADESFSYFAIVYRAEILQLHYADKSLDDKKADWALEDAKEKFLHAQIGMEALSFLEGESGHSIRSASIAASWDAQRDLSDSVGENVWYLQDRLDDHYMVMGKISPSEWSSLWRRLALQYLELNSLYEKAALEMRDFEKPIEHELRTRLIKSQLSALDSAMGRGGEGANK